MLGNFACVFFLSVDFFQNQLFPKVLSGIPSRVSCQTVWIQIRPNFFVGPSLGPNCLQRLSADSRFHLLHLGLMVTKPVFWVSDKV